MVDFEVGKWYKGTNNNYYFKFLSKTFVKGISSNYNNIKYTERCYNGKYEITSCSISNNDYEKCALNNPVTFEELQKILPEGHPDLQLNLTYELW